MNAVRDQEHTERFSQDDVIDLRQYWRTIMNHKWGIMGFTALVTLLAILAVLAMQPIYRATATLLIESQQAKVVSIEEVYGMEGDSSEYLLTQFEILKSRRLAEKVVQELDLVDHPMFNQPSRLKQYLPDISFDWREYLPVELPEKAAEPVEETNAEAAKFKRVVDAFMGQLSISPVRKTQLVRISYESNDPELAAEIANAVGNAYIEDSLQAKLDLTVKASSWLSEQLQGLREQVNEAEQKMQAFRDEEKIVGAKGGLDIANRELDLVAEKLVDARRQRLELESVYRQIQSLGRDNPDRLELVPQVLQHPLVQRMKENTVEVERRISELSKRYGEKHPKMQAARSELASAKSNLNKQIISVVRGLENNYQAARANERSLERSLQGTKGNIQSLNRKEYKLRELQQDVDTKRALYDTFFTRFNETSATGDLKTANARVSDPAVVPTSPIKPKRKMIVVATFIAATLFAIAFAFLLQALNNTVRSLSDVENKLGAAMLGLLPRLKKKRRNPNPSYRQFIDEPHSTYAEALRTIRTGVVLSALDSPHKVLTVTSTVPGEGKTTTALGLACALGQMEKVLLLEADMRRPAIARALGLDTKAPGVSGLVAGTAELSACVQRFEDGNIDIMTAGVIPPNPSELLSSKRFSTVLMALESKYDRIVIDTAPLQAVSDALVLAPLAGAMIYVVKSDSTPYQQAREGLKRLKEVNAPLIGVVLTQVNVKAGLKYGQSYGGYYDTYGYSANSGNYG